MFLCMHAGMQPAAAAAADAESSPVHSNQFKLNPSVSCFRTLLRFRRFYRRKDFHG